MLRNYNLCTCVMLKKLLGPFLRLYWSCQYRLRGLFWPKVVADYVGPAHKQKLHSGGFIGDQ